MGRNPLRLALLFAAAVVLYGVGLEHTPPHLHHDEVMIAMQAQSIAQTGRDFEGRLLPLYFSMPQLGDRAWYQPAIIYFTALFLTVLPAWEASFRFPTAVIAALDVVLMFLVARRLFGSERWGWVAAALLAATPTHYLLGRVAFDFIYPLPFVLGWLLALLVYLERREPWRLFVATTVLGAGFYSYIASMLMMPLYVAMTLAVLFAQRLLTVRTAAIAVAGFAWPLVLLMAWIVREPSFVADVLFRYSLDREAGFSVSALVRKVSIYWTFFDPGFLFLMGGYTHLTASTRLVGVFLAPFLVLIPLGVLQVVTTTRTPVAYLVIAGFLTAPLAAALTVAENYASSRQLPILVFGVLLATYGIQRARAYAPPIVRAAAIGLLALLPLHYAFFMQHYFGAYHGYSAAPFEWNHRGALEGIIERSPAGSAEPIFLTRTRDHWMDSHWRLTLSRLRRPDLLARTVYFDSTKAAPPEMPAGALVLANVDDKSLMAGVASGAFAEVLRVPEPADEPVFFILRRNP